MLSVRRILNRAPRVKKIVKSVYSFISGVPQVTYGELSNEDIRRLVGRQNPVIVEIGANDGGHTIRFVETFENARIYCFEPDPRAAARFRRNVGTRPNVQLFEMAISDRVGDITFYQSGGHRDERDEAEMPEGWDLSGSIRKPTGHIQADPRVTFENRLTVPTSTLDAWAGMHGLDHIDFLWMDVQGAEGDVFNGAARMLPRTRILYTECADTEQYDGQLTTKRLLARLPNFEVLVRYPNDVLLRNKQPVV